MAWWYLFANDKKTDPKKIEMARGKIESTETTLRESGVTEEAIKELGDRAEKFIFTPIKDMTHNQLETYSQLIFGPKATYEPEKISYMMDTQGKAVRDHRGRSVKSNS